MSKPLERRREYTDQLLGQARRPSMRAMEAAAAELAREREADPPVAQPSSPAEEGTAQPEIALPEQEGHPHGQLVVAFNPQNQQAWGFNWTEHPWRGDDSIRDMGQRLAAFLRDETQDYLEFLSPHDGQLHCLTREGARRVLAVDHARTVGQVAPHSDQVRLVRMTPEMLGRGRIHVPR